MKTLIIYLIFINITAFVLYGIDKHKARKSKWRISEAALMWVAAAGGSLGAILGMRVWHHKTLHKKFRFGIPAILVAQLALAVWLVWLKG